MRGRKEANRERDREMYIYTHIYIQPIERERGPLSERGVGRRPTDIYIYMYMCMYIYIYIYISTYKHI